MRLKDVLHGPRCADLHCRNEKFKASHLNNTKSKLELTFKEESFKGFEIIDVFYQYFWYGQNLSMVRFKCPQNHITTTRATHVIHKKTQCNDLICMVQKALRNSFNQKIFTFADNTTSIYMGYEKYLLDILSKKYHTSCINTTLDLISKSEYCHKFRYEHNNKIHCYLPDIVVECYSFHRYYEVKSLYTLNNFGKDPLLGAINLSKWKFAAVCEGKIFDVFIFGTKGEIVYILRIYQDGTLKEFDSYLESEIDTSFSGSVDIENYQFRQIGSQTEETEEETEQFVSLTHWLSQFDTDELPDFNSDDSE